MAGDHGVSDLIDYIGCSMFINGGVVALAFGIVNSVVVCDCSCLGAGAADVSSVFCSSCSGCDTFSTLEVEVFSSLVFDVFLSSGVCSCLVLAACAIAEFVPAVMFTITNCSVLSVGTLSALVDRIFPALTDYAVTVITPIVKNPSTKLVLAVVLTFIIVCSNLHYIRLSFCAI